MKIKRKNNFIITSLSILYSTVATSANIFERQNDCKNIKTDYVLNLYNTDPPNASSNPDGTIVYGTGIPNTKVIVKDANGIILGQSTVNSNGHFEIELDRPLENGENANVILIDSQNNESQSNIIIGHKDTFPPKINSAVINNYNSSVAVKVLDTYQLQNESNATVNIYLASTNQLIGTGRTNSSGEVVIMLNSAVKQNQYMNIIAVDTDDNASLPYSLLSAIVLEANKDIIKADIDISLKSNLNFKETKLYKKLPTYNGININSNEKYIEINFNNDSYETSSLNIHASTNNLKSINEMIRFTLYKNVNDNNWQQIVDNTNMASFSNYFKLSNNSSKLKTVNNFDNGKFKLIAKNLNPNLTEDNLRVEITKKNVVTITKVNQAVGNIISNDLSWPAAYIHSISNTISGNFTLTSNEIDITGNYGILKIEKDGNYTYSPKKSLDIIGKVDHFVYTITDSIGNTSSIDIYVQIGCDEKNLTWDINNPQLPAVIN